MKKKRVIIAVCLLAVSLFISPGIYRAVTSTCNIEITNATNKEIEYIKLIFIPTDSSENEEVIFSDFAPWNKINEKMKIPRPWQKEYTIRLYMKLKGYQEFHFDSALEDSGTDIGYLDNIFFKGIYLLFEEDATIYPNEIQIYTSCGHSFQSFLGDKSNISIPLVKQQLL